MTRPTAYHFIMQIYKYFWNGYNFFLPYREKVVILQPQTARHGLPRKRIFALFRVCETRHFTTIAEEHG